MNRSMCLSALIGWVLLAPVSLNAAGTGSAARIEKTVLEVEDAPRGSDRFSASRVGKSLGLGHKVRTGRRAKAEIILTDDDSVIRLSQLSDVVIEANREIDIPKGSLRFDFKSPARIRAGTTVADVRGSSGGLVVDGDEIRGTVFTGAVVLRPGAAANRAGTPSLVTPVTETFGAGEVEIRAGQAFRYNRVSGQVSIFAAPPEDFSDESGEVVKRPPLRPRELRLFRLLASLRDQPLRYVLDQAATQGNLSRRVAREIAARLRERRRVGDVNAGILPPRPRNQLALSSSAPTPNPAREIQHASGSGSTQRGYFSPRFDGNVFLQYGEGGNGAAAVRFRHYGALPSVYYEVAANPTYDFRNENVRTDVTDAYMLYRRPGLGELTIGRQRFLMGPVQNTLFGTLIRQGGRDIQDAVNWSPDYGDNSRFSTDLAYLIDAFPTGGPASQRGSQNGFMVRQAVNTPIGEIGGTALRGNFLNQWGTTLDWSLDAIPDKLVFYGEFGADGLQNQIRTFGLYFPEVYTRTGIDLFIEQSRLNDFGRQVGTSLNSEWLVRAYREITGNLTGLVTMDRRTDSGVTFGVGLVYKIEFH